MGITWDESLQINHAAIDMQHREIFEQINSLSERLNEGADDIEVRDLLNYLNIYSKKHFFDEEKLMVQYNYYGIHKQKKQHTQFRNEIDELSQMLRKNVQASELAERMEITLLRYFVNHINQVDKELANFINFQDKLAQEAAK